MPAHTIVFPAIDPDKTGTEEELTLNDALGDEPQLLVAVTTIVPDTPAIALKVLDPFANVHPVGKVHKYPDAPVIGLTLYV